MKRSRPLLSVIALTVLAAWGNAQAMACCRLPELLAALQTAVTETAPKAEAPDAPMAKDHSCCPGANNTEDRGSGGTAASSQVFDASASPVSAAGCGSTASDVAAPCCEPAPAAAVTAVSAAFTSSTDVAALFPSPVVTVLLPLAAVAPSGSSPPPSSCLLSASLRYGSPPYLSLQHLLI